MRSAPPSSGDPLARTPSPIEVDPTQESPPLDWAALFGNPHPVDVEIGCGNARFLMAIARQLPARNFLGVERSGKYYRKAVAHLTRADLPNARLLRADGLDLLDRWVAPGSLQRIHLYFPDPWPKKRHHKRRIFRPALLALAARALLPGAEFRLATDHAEYGAVIRTLFAQQRALFEPLPWATDDRDRLPTSYSERWRRAGRRLWWARYVRAAGAVGRRTPTSPLDASGPDATFRSVSGPSD